MSNKEKETIVNEIMDLLIKLTDTDKQEKEKPESSPIKMLTIAEYFGYNYAKGGHWYEIRSTYIYEI